MELRGDPLPGWMIRPERWEWWDCLTISLSLSRSEEGREILFPCFTFQSCTLKRERERETLIYNFTKFMRPEKMNSFYFFSPNISKKKHYFTFLSLLFQIWVTNAVRNNFLTVCGTWYITKTLERTTTLLPRQSLSDNGYSSGLVTEEIDQRNFFSLTDTLGKIRERERGEDLFKYLSIESQKEPFPKKFA